MLINVSTSSRTLYVTSNYSQSAICTTIPCMYIHRYLELSEVFGCSRNSCSPMLDAKENRCQYIRHSYCSSFPARRRVGKEKCLHATIYIGQSFNREIPYIFSRYVQRGFPPFSTPAERTDGNREILLRKPRKSRLMTGRESKPPSPAPLAPIMTENNGECTYLYAS